MIPQTKRDDSSNHPVWFLESAPPICHGCFAKAERMIPQTRTDDSWNHPFSINSLTHKTLSVIAVRRRYLQKRVAKSLFSEISCNSIAICRRYLQKRVCIWSRPLHHIL